MGKWREWVVPVITNTFIKRVKSRARKYEVTCRQVKGLILRVLPSGKRVFYYRGVVDGKDQRVRLGLTNEVTLADARKLVREIVEGNSLPDPPLKSVRPKRARRAKAEVNVMEQTGPEVQVGPETAGARAVESPRAGSSGGEGGSLDAGALDLVSRPAGRPTEPAGEAEQGTPNRAQLAEGKQPSRDDILSIRAMAAIVVRDHVEVALKPGTRSNYHRALREIVKQFGERSLEDVSHREVTHWHRAMAKTKSAANFKVRVLHLLFKKAQEWGYIPWQHRLPTQGVKYFRTSPIERFLTPQERERLERVLQEGLEKKGNQKGSLTWFNVAAIRLLSLTGMRRGEVLSLKWSYIDRANRIVTLPESKTGKSIRPISAFTVEYLNELERKFRKQGCKWVLYGRDGNPLHPGSLWTVWSRVRKMTGLEDVRIHDLRHSAASDALNAGVPLAVVGAILGHKSPQTTARYAHVASSVARDATDRMTAGMARIVRGVGG